MLFENLHAMPEDTPPAEAAQRARSFADAVRDYFEADSWARSDGFIIENWQWLGLLALVAVGVVLERITSGFLRYTAKRITRSEKVILDSKRMTSFVRPFGVMITWWVFISLLPVIDIGQNGLARALDLMGTLILSVAGMLAAWRFVDLVCDFLRARAELTDNKFDDMLVPLMRRTLKIFVFIAGAAFVASNLTTDIWKIVAGASIGGAILALAFKDSVENVFGTFTVLLDKPFELGDWITVGEVDGTVERVGFRSTRVRTFYNSIITVPNRHFVSAKVDNWGARRYRRIKATLGLTYSTPPEKVEAFCEGVREVIRQHPYTRKDYFHVYLNGFGASTLDIMLYCFVETPDWSMELREKHRLFADILRVAERLGVQFAFPTQTLHMIQDEAEQHPDRPEHDHDGSRVGRDVGMDVAQHTLEPYGDSKPGKVKFIQASSPISAPGDEGDGS